jgi:DnaJ-domain-containing protein 1
VQEQLARGDFARLAYRLGRVHATGVLTIDVPRTRPEVLILRRGHLFAAEGADPAQRLARIAGLDGAQWSFDGGTAAYPPGATGRTLGLAVWARRHLESQVDTSRGERLVHELAGVRIAIRADHAPEAADDTDRRMIAAMNLPRRLDQIWPLARVPRFRLLAFLHFLRAVGGLVLFGIALEANPRSDAYRVLGVDGDAPREAVKRAYHRLARALHPDLQPGISDERRRELEHKLAEVTAAYAHVLSQ